jgi:GT2 family glycosyltransferase
MKFSLILATVNRLREFDLFVKSLLEQVEVPVQLIVVDQNASDRLRAHLPEPSPRLEVLYLQNAPGLSRARNAALPHVTGDVVAFPDDDCVYEPGTLAMVERLLASNPTLGGVTGRSLDEHGRTSGGIFATEAGAVSLLDVWIKATSFTIFLRKSVVDLVGDFDESLGLGSGTPFGAAEDTDYVIRAIRAGAYIEYYPGLSVRHPDKTDPINGVVYSRATSYGAGMGRVLAKHQYPLPFCVRSLARPLFGAGIAALQLQFALSRMRLHTAQGRLAGLIAGFRDDGA